MPFVSHFIAYWRAKKLEGGKSVRRSLSTGLLTVRGGSLFDYSAPWMVCAPNLQADEQVAYKSHAPTNWLHPKTHPTLTLNLPQTPKPPPLPVCRVNLTSCFLHVICCKIIKKIILHLNWTELVFEGHHQGHGSLEFSFCWINPSGNGDLKKERWSSHDVKYSPENA